MKNILVCSILLLGTLVDAQNGRVGINTTTPTETLDVNGTLRVQTINVLTPSAADPILTADVNGVVKKLNASQVVAQAVAGNAKVLTKSPLTGDGSIGNAIEITRYSIVSGTSSNTASSPLTLDSGANNSIVGNSDASLAINNTAPLWNGNKLQGTMVANTNPSNGQALVYNSVTSQWEPTTLNFPKKGTKTLTNATLIAGSNIVTMNVPGAMVGNSAHVSTTSDLGAPIFIQTSWVSAADTVSVRIFSNGVNTTGVNTTLVAVVN